ncbi:MAG: hypothetical protein ACRDRA_14750 [Pseudonocardiaceae bacterium]
MTLSRSLCPPMVAGWIQASCARDRELAEERAQVFSDELLSVLLRHPDLRRVRVRVDLELSGREIIRLAEDAGVHRIELVGEPEILDAPNELGTAQQD